MSIEAPTPSANGEPAGYEVYPGAEHTRRLQELFLGYSDDDREEVRQSLQAGIEKLQANLLDTDQQQALAAVGGILEWLNLGKPGDPLPNGLVATLDRTGDATIVFDDRLPYINRSVVSVFNKLDKLGVSEKLQAIANEDQTFEKEAVLRTIIESSAEYNLLLGFASQDRAPVSAPLNPFWRHIREAQVEHEIRNRYSVPEGESIMPASPADHALRKAYQQLDDERMTQREQQANTQDEIAKARAYALPYIKAAYEADGKKQFKALVFDEEYIGGPAIASYNDPEYPDEVYETTDNAAALLMQETYVGPPEQRFIVRYFMACALEEIANIHNQGAIEQLLHDATAEAVRDLYAEFQRGSMPKFYHYDVDEAAQLLLAPKLNAIVPPHELNQKQVNFLNGNWKQVFTTETSLISEHELWRLSQIAIGETLRYGPDNFRTNSRLILPTAPRQLPETIQEADLTIELDRYDWGNAHPLIPGYRLVRANQASESRHRFEFVVDETGDPYTPCEVGINPDDLLRLANAYADIGLDSLSKSLVNRETTTVEELRSLIAGHSEYYTPTNVHLGPVLDDFNQQTKHASRLSNFTHSVRDDRLCVQCTGANQFLRLSLDELFGAGSANIVNGKVLKENKATITALGHQQTVFTHEGTRYILDATPAGGTFEQPSGDMLAPTGYYNERHPQYVQNLSSLATRAATQTEYVAAPAPSLTEIISAQHTSLVHQLNAYFDTNTTQSLYARLLQLPAHDPARRTMEMYAQYMSGASDAEAVLKQAAYIELCASADPSSRKRFGFDHYTTHFLESLRSHAWQLQGLVQVSTDERATD